jgi:phage baseplate assembly protein W
MGLVSATDNVAQAIVNRLSTRRGEMAELGHSDYGSRIHELIGEPNNNRTRALVELYIRECLDREPRVQGVIELSMSEQVRIQGSRDLLDVTLKLQLLLEDDELQLTIPVTL